MPHYPDLKGYAGLRQVAKTIRFAASLETGYKAATWLGRFGGRIDFMAEILVIDDDVHTLDLVTSILEAAGHTVERVSDGQGGVDAVLNGDVVPDLIVTDLNMRGVSGWDVVRQIREGMPESSTPILALSAFTTAQDRDEAFKAGCTAYENKPIDRDRFVARIDRLLAAE